MSLTPAEHDDGHVLLRLTNPARAILALGRGTIADDPEAPPGVEKVLAALLIDLLPSCETVDDVLDFCQRAVADPICVATLESNPS